MLLESTKKRGHLLSMTDVFFFFFSISYPSCTMTYVENPGFRINDLSKKQCWSCPGGGLII